MNELREIEDIHEKIDKVTQLEFLYHDTDENLSRKDQHKTVKTMFKSSLSAIRLQSRSFCGLSSIDRELLSLTFIMSCEMLTTNRPPKASSTSKVCRLCNFHKNNVVSCVILA